MWSGRPPHISVTQHAAGCARCGTDGAATRRPAGGLAAVGLLGAACVARGGHWPHRQPGAVCAARGPAGGRVLRSPRLLQIGEEELWGSVAYREFLRDAARHDLAARCGGPCGTCATRVLAVLNRRSRAAGGICVSEGLAVATTRSWVRARTGSRTECPSRAMMQR